MRFFLFLFVKFLAALNERSYEIQILCICTFQPTKGRITAAGEDVRTFDKREWARVVSLVNQVHSSLWSIWIIACFLNNYNYLKSKIAGASFIFSVCWWKYSLWSSWWDCSQRGCDKGSQSSQCSWIYHFTSTGIINGSFPSYFDFIYFFADHVLILLGLWYFSRWTWELAEWWTETGISVAYLGFLVN